MRQALRLLASVKPVSSTRFLEAGQPTGLTGLYTHNSPRSALLDIYQRTLSVLTRYPESSLYRQSVERNTRHRMGIVEAVVPAGYDEWSRRAVQRLQDDGDIVAKAKIEGYRVSETGDRIFIERTEPIKKDVREEEWDGEKDLGPGVEGLRGEEERGDVRQLFEPQERRFPKDTEWEAEPQWTVEQVEKVENTIQAGLIEEVVEVAESELNLAELMLQYQVWEGLAEQPPEGQWTYFEREKS